MADDPNPPAFPSVALNDPGHPASAPGMTLLDWFAGQALAGALACPSMRAPMMSAEYATLSYQLADAMLAERNRETDHAR